MSGSNEIFINPVKSKTTTINSGQGKRVPPVVGASSNHKGIDIKAARGTPVYATASGTVGAGTNTGFNGGYGNLVVLKHANGLETRYAHLDSLVVSQGSSVKQGQLIGYVGDSGRTTGPHLHYEVRQNGKVLPAANYVNGKASTGAPPQAFKEAGASPKSGAGQEPPVAEVKQTTANIISNLSSNILNNYRSYTYNFALGVLPSTATIENKRSFDYRDNAIRKYQIINSSGKGGKGDNGISGISTDVVNATGVNSDQAKKLVEGFNKSSPGRFDMYIDDLSITSIVSVGDKAMGATMGTNLTFTVFEPYSMGGFMEALTAAALAAGYPNFNTAAFVLKIWFTGYPDNLDLPTPVVIPDSTRYFDFRFNTINASVDETGTKYQVGGFMHSAQGYGSASQQPTTFSVSGKTVFEMLKSYFDGINTSHKREKGEASSTNNPEHDYYEILCPLPMNTTTERGVDDGLIFSTRPDKSYPTSINSTHNKIAAAKMFDVNKTNGNVKIDTQKTSSQGYAGQKDTGTRAAVSPNTTADKIPEIQMDSDFPIHHGITKIILMSDYVSNDVLKTQAKTNDDTLYYFKVRTEIEELNYNSTLNRYSRVYRYIVEPFKISKSYLTTETQGKIDYTSIKGEIKKEYNYLYSGKNTDVLNFKIELNNLFVAVIGAANGNKPEGTGLAANAAPTDVSKVSLPESAVAKQNATGESVPQQNVGEMARVPIDNTPTMKYLLSFEDPYTALARLFHEKVLNTPEGNLMQLDLEILGDPYYLSNDSLTTKLRSAQEDDKGQAPIGFTTLYINTKFQTIDDINADDYSGSPAFSTDRKILPFSGIYELHSVESSFRSGTFTQRLIGRRAQAQVLENQELPPANPLVETASDVPGARVREDSADPTVNKTGITQDSISLSKLFNKSLPGVLTGVGSSLKLAAGATASFSSQLGTTAAADLTKGINVSPSVLNPATISSDAATIATSGSLMSETGNIQDAQTNLAINVNKTSPNVSESLTQEVEYIGKDFSQSVGSADMSIQQLQNTILTDPSGIANKLGIDPSVLSGASPQFASKLTNELNQVSKLVPVNTDLGTLAEKGVSLSTIQKTDLQNLPALQPKRSAPAPIFDPARDAITDSYGSVLPLLEGKTNLAALTDVNEIKNTVGSAASGFDTIENSVVTAFTDKISSAQSGVNDVIAQSSNITNTVGSLSQNYTRSPMPATANLGSVESNAALVRTVVQTGASGSQDYSVTAQLGSKQKTSPLTDLVNNYNTRGKIV